VYDVPHLFIVLLYSRQIESREISTASIGNIVSCGYNVFPKRDFFCSWFVSDVIVAVAVITIGYSFFSTYIKYSFHKLYFLVFVLSPLFSRCAK